MMKKAITICKWLLLGLAFLFILLIAGSYVNHRWQIPREEAAYPPLGKMVTINGHRLHVYAEGERGDLTLVFMSGSGTTAPMLDFKGLYTGQYRPFMRLCRHRASSSRWSPSLHALVYYAWRPLFVTGRRL